MAWKCGECGAIEGKEKVTVDSVEQEVKVHAVCHHCGKLLCQKDIVLAKDGDFDDDFDGKTVEAYHCKDCSETIHP